MRAAVAMAVGTLSLLCVLGACGGGSSAVPAGQRVGPALTAALAGAEGARAPWRCAAEDGPVLAEETVAGWKLAGHAMTRERAGDLTIGAIADAGGAAPATIAALGRLKTKLAKADVVVALGGMGTTQAELEATLGAIADAAYPVVALPGDLEGAGALASAIAALRARGQAVVDGRLAQRIEAAGATVATVAGAGDASRLVAGADGCAYRAPDVAAVLGELSARPGLRVLATAEAPRTTVDGEAAGELALTPGAGSEIDVVLHGPVAPAPTRAKSGGRDAEAAQVSPGTADATPRLPGPPRPPSAGLLVLHGATWTWKPLVDE